MKLNITERWLLRRAFAPKSISLIDLDLWDDLAEKTKYTPEEITRFGGEIPCLPDKDFEIEITLTREQIQMLQNRVQQMDREGQIPYDPDNRTAVDLAKKILNYGIQSK